MLKYNFHSNLSLLCYQRIFKRFFKHNTSQNSSMIQFFKVNLNVQNKTKLFKAKASNIIIDNIFISILQKVQNLLRLQLDME